MDWPPIVERMYELALWLVVKAGRFPKDQRFLLGARIVTKALDIQDQLLAAALTPAGPEKRDRLAKLDLDLERLRYLLRLAKDVRCLSPRAWQYAARHLLEIGKSLGGWRKSLSG